VPGVEIIKTTRWYLKNQRFWFYVECEGDEHAVCMSTLDGLFFVDHHYSSLDVMKVEADLTGYADLHGCHRFAALWTDPQLQIRECVVRDMGQGPALIHVGLGLPSGPAIFWAIKQTAFIFTSWLRNAHPRASVRWEK